MENTPKVSVLMPAYNVEKYIGEAIDSILGQTFKDFELIIIDDGSTDNTWKIIQEYKEKDNRIQISQNLKNLGISETRNELIGLAKAEYIVWQDADDISYPYRIEHQYEYMETHPEVGLCGGYLQFFNEKGDQSLRKYAPDDETLRKNIFRYQSVAQPAAIVKKECFEETGLFPHASPVAEDLAVSFQVGTKYKFANLQEPIIKYRENQAGVTFTKLRTMEMFTLFLRTRYATNPAYHMRFSDKVYNFLQMQSIYLIPAKWKIALFNFIRNS